MSGYASDAPSETLLYDCSIHGDGLNIHFQTCTYDTVLSIVKCCEMATGSEMHCRFFNPKGDKEFLASVINNAVNAAVTTATKLVPNAAVATATKLVPNAAVTTATKLVPKTVAKL